MITCFVALVLRTIAFVGWLPVKYERYARDSFTCLTRYVTFRPCNTNLHDRVRVTVISRLMINHMRLARFVYRHFEAISWIFSISVYIILGIVAYWIATRILS
jgi:hypothetical protein